MKMKIGNIIFWIVTVLCIVSLILGPIFIKIIKNLMLGAFMYASAIILWLVMIIISETQKHNNSEKDNTADNIEENISTSDFWEKCKTCEYFDGYDICLHKKNFGSVTDESKKVCKNKNLWQRKQ